MITHFLGCAGTEDVKHPEFEKGSVVERQLSIQKRIYTVKNDKISRGLK